MSALLGLGLVFGGLVVGVLLGGSVAFLILRNERSGR